MTNLIRQFMDKVEEAIPWVTESKSDDSYSASIGLAQEKSVADHPVGFTKNTHYRVRTKVCSTIVEAEQELIKELSNVILTKDISRLYWRVAPMVDCDYSWEKGQKEYGGFARATILLSKDDPEDQESQDEADHLINTHPGY